ncbi:agmatine deiminase family protein [Aestuariibacter salexigens]|uniref:agmatine deiminase family protein n=1 Tax=Aestuariibacter salexigens TaxID=226010 RepID=UPI00041B3A6A|nr:agmatine deiminase family protein [Aestuariibacter salexigens]
MQPLSRLLPEWAPQDAIILAWPDEQTDWRLWLSQVRQVYLDIINALNDRQIGVILLVRDGLEKDVQALLAQQSQVLIVNADYNDTWVRDYAFLTCESANGRVPVEFVFNGWGNKFDASKDNRVNRHSLARLCRLPLHQVNIVAEGGAIEIDESGHLLSTASCLFNPERNGDMTEDAYKRTFTSELGAAEVSILQHGHLEGDDTDGHIDTLVRFTPDKGLVIQTSYNRPEDPHFSELTALTDECREVFPDHRLFELPLPYIVNVDGDRLPASYANFLITNGAILAPVYQQPEDDEALDVLSRAYPQHDIVAINCRPLIEQFGSLHCISMQVPKHTLLDDVVEQLNSGVSVYV